MPDRWTVIERSGPGPFSTWVVVLVDHQGNQLRQHAGYPYQREADRVAATLNVRDGLAA
jgi:hypothetical protein